MERHIRQLPAEPGRQAAVRRCVALGLGISLGEARSLLMTLPAELPLRLETDTDARAAAEQLAEDLSELGAELGDAQPAGGSDAARPRCPQHRSLIATVACETCHHLICTVCAAGGEAGRAEGDIRNCHTCAKKQRRSKKFFRIRLTVLLVVLAGVIFYAYADITSRRARVEWDRTLVVAVVVVERAPIDEAALSLMEHRLETLEQQLNTEMQRYRPGSPPPFDFILFGPVAGSAPPEPPSAEEVLEVASYSWNLWRYVSEVDDAAAIDGADFDSRIYLIAAPPVDAHRRTVEGLSEQGGRIGVVDIALDKESVDFALFVMTHELFHTLGATDKYDVSGNIIVPDGLPEPDREPRYPQPKAELMARHRATGPGENEPPDGLIELAIGQKTANEIGWATSP